MDGNGRPRTSLDDAAAMYPRNADAESAQELQHSDTEASVSAEVGLQKEKDEDTLACNATPLNAVHDIVRNGPKCYERS